jgi:hypothetical protein
VTAQDDWLSAFPLRPATEAVEALCESWTELASRFTPHFNRQTKEPKLTRVLKAHVEAVIARRRGLLGMWTTEGVINTIDFATGEITKESRTDIVYGWNNEHVGIQLVFEFKKLNDKRRSREHYLGKDGLVRFVTGTYGAQQPVAAMVGILTDPYDIWVPPLRNALSDAVLGPPLRLRHEVGAPPFQRPSQLFAAADFDTEHDRPPALAPTHGWIRVSHFFLPFGDDETHATARKEKPRNKASKGKTKVAGPRRRSRT